MKSSIFNAVGDFFALDIGTSAIRIVQLKGNSSNKALFKFGAVAVDVKTALSDAAADQQKIAELVNGLVAETGVTTNNVAVGLASNKTFVTVVDVPKMTAQEFGRTIKYQVEQYIPMALDEAKVDWAILGDSPKEEGKMEVLLASVSKKFSENRLDMLESIGLNVISFEPDSLALARSLTPIDDNNARLIVDMGEYNTDIVVMYGGAPRLVRSIPSGGQTLLRSVVQNLSIDENQARQFVYKFGMDSTKLEGKVAKALAAGAEVVATEVQKSIKFFNDRYPNVSMNSITASGATGILPGFGQYLSQAAGGIPVQPGNSWQNVSYSSDVHEQLMSINHQFAVAVGLGLEIG
jgi:type IV pilus assembly protein PilM